MDFCRVQHNEDSPSIYFIPLSCPRPPFSILLAHPASGFLTLPVDFPPRDARITGSTSDRNHPWKGIIHGIACNISHIEPRRKKKRQHLLPHIISLATHLCSLLSKEGVGSSRFLHQASSKSPQQPDPTLPLLFFNTPPEPSFDLKHSMYIFSQRAEKGGGVQRVGIVRRLEGV